MRRSIFERPAFWNRLVKIHRKKSLDQSEDIRKMTNSQWAFFTHVSSNERAVFKSRDTFLANQWNMELWELDAQMTNLHIYFDKP